jgi:hypothetical protein
MIDLKDVRPGNWVIKSLGVDEDNQPIQEYKAVTIDEYLYTFVRVYFPITITTDVLGKSGFKHEFGDWYMNLATEGIDNGMPFLRYKHQEKCWYLKEIKIPAQPVYLHQLQNLYYALTKKELTVRLGQLQGVVT